jgi:O-antigen/teichoic acid export membrane protein
MMSLIRSSRVYRTFRHVTASRIAKAYFTSILGVISGLLTQLLFIRELTATVTPTQFALYAFVFQIVNYLTVFQLGMDFTVSREVAMHLGAGNTSLANYSFAFIRRFNKSILLIAAVAIVVLALFFYAGYALPADYDDLTASLLVLAFGVFQLLTFFTRPYHAALIGTNYQNIVNLNNVFINIISTFLAYILLQQGFGLFAMPVSLVAWSVINIFVLKYIVQQKCSWISDAAPVRDRSLDKSSIRFGVLSTLGGIAWTIEATADVVILNAAGLMHLVGIYVIWWRFPQMMFDLASRLTTSAYPSISAAHGSGANSKLLLNKLMIAVTCLAFMIAAGIYLWLPSFVNLWVGQPYAYDNYTTLSMLVAILIFLRITGNCIGMYIVSIGRVRITTAFSWIQATIKVVAGYFMVTRFGMEGLLITSIFCALLQVAGLTAYLYKQDIVDLKLISFVSLLVLTILGLWVLKNEELVRLPQLIWGMTTTLFISVGFVLVMLFSFGYRDIFLKKANP